MQRIAWLAAMAMCGAAQAAQPLPPAADLAPSESLPDALVDRDGTRVASAEAWPARRRPELLTLFQHYMYGYLPAAPANIRGTVERVDRDCLAGKATLKQVKITFGPPETPVIHLLMVVPNTRTGPVPVFVGLNFRGNHALLDDPQIPLPVAWVPRGFGGDEQGRASEAGRSSEKEVWALDQAVGRGYAVATCYAGDIDPDRNDFTDGVHPHFGRTGQTERGPHDWGTVAAWAWGLHRVVDYLVTDKDIDQSRIAVVGHSRLGKAALVAGAFDERIALTVANQAGCGGSAPNRKTPSALETAETVLKINKRFPHWFCDEFKQFNDQVERLPFDQHCLVALCAPRPVLFTNATEDLWADPEGQFRMLQAATPVYRLLGAGGLEATAMPEPGKLVDSRLGYYIREGKHSMTRGDWKVYLDVADKHFAASR
jgi:hypothetical protein